jgi:hypothetical protein
VTIELSARRLLTMLVKERDMVPFDKETSGQSFYWRGEKVTMINRSPNIQWQVDYWRAQRDDKQWEYERGRGH